MTWSITNKINVGFGVALGFMMLIGALAHQSTRQLVETVRLEIHTHKVLNELHDVLFELQTAETGQRGYILTGESAYLDSYQSAITVIETELRALRQLTADNVNQQQRLDELEPLVRAKFAELRETIALRDREGFEAALAIVRTGQGKVLMDAIQRLIDQMQREEDFLLEVRAVSAEDTAAQLTLVITAGSVLVFGFVLFAALGIHRDVTRRRRAEEALERAQAALEERVALRTQELSRANLDLQKEIAERRSIEHRLRKSYDDTLSILDGLQLGTAVLDKDGRVTFLSHMAQNLCGKHGDAALGMPWTALLPFSDTDKARLAEMIREQRRDRVRVPVSITMPTGRHYWMEIDVRDDPHEPSRRVIFMYDVTEIYDLRRQLDEKARFYGMVGRSEPMQRVFQQIRDVAAVDSTVLIEGETGTGKELVARAIHHFSHRRNKPFIAVNCAGITESLLGSQLFGHRKGAFTGAIADHQGLFEAADDGTIFLDEIGDVPARVQSSLLRVLEEREITRLGESRPRPIDVRVIAATHHDLSVDVARQTFRADLLYRIRVARIQPPPLRERRADLPLLVGLFLGQLRSATGKPVEGVSDEAMRILLNYAWPGNVRELRNAIEYAVISCSGPALRATDLPPELTDARETEPTLEQALTSADERRRVTAALKLARGNRTAAARLLSISRATLYRRLTELRDLERPELRPLEQL